MDVVMGEQVVPVEKVGDLAGATIYEFDKSIVVPAEIKDEMLTASFAVNLI